LEFRELLRRSQTRIDLLFTMSKIPQPRPLGARMRSDVFADVCFLSRSSARLRSLELRRGSLRKKACRAEAGIASEGWWSQTGSNRRPHACKARALPAELWPRTRRRMLLSRALCARLRWRYGAAAFIQGGLPSRSCRAAKAGGPGKT
jgi:hypothetical protein